MGLLSGIVYARGIRSHRRETHLIIRRGVRTAAVQLSGTFFGQRGVRFVSFRLAGFSFGFARRHVVRLQSTLAPAARTDARHALWQGAPSPTRRASRSNFGGANGCSFSFIIFSFVHHIQLRLDLVRSHDLQLVDLGPTSCSTASFPSTGKVNICAYGQRRERH